MYRKLGPYKSHRAVYSHISNKILSIIDSNNGGWDKIYVINTPTPNHPNHNLMIKNSFQFFNKLLSKFKVNKNQ